MGFHVRIDEESERLIRLVKSDPSKVIGKLYSAYLLFLIGERDEAELKWLLENAKALDSLTGKHLAYAVFAKQFKVKLRTHVSESDRRPRNVGEINADVLGTKADVTRLVQDGGFGMIVDGDEITAITYGTDLVARELGLLDKLPCVVIVDAVPKKELCVVTLDSQLTASLMPLLRKSIAEFSEVGGDATIKHDAERLIEVQESIAREHLKDATLRTEIARATATIDKLNATISSGKATADASYLQRIVQKREHDRDSFVAELERLPREQPGEFSRLQLELESILKEHRRHNNLLFSEIVQRHVRSLGLQSKLRSAKASTLGYIGSLLKPEVLLKVWALISP
jgi:hypothetical protein